MTTFKKLDEYLKDTDYNIANALISSMNISLSKAHELLQNIDIAQETELVYILDDNETSHNKKRQLIKEFFQQLGLMEEDNYFNGVDIVGDYNYKCMITDQASRDVYMDWLEENSYEFLIDNNGRFAVKCNNRDNTYRAERAFDACKKKVWLKDELIKNVDPIKKRMRMSSIKSVPLNDSASLEHSPFNTFKDKSGSPSPFTTNTVGDEFDEGKNITKNTIKKKNNARLKNVAKSLNGGKNPAKVLSDPQFHNRIVKDTRKYDKKKERQKKITDESITIDSTEGIVGLTTILPIMRLRTLAGLDNNLFSITESLQDALSDLESEVINGVDLDIMATELAKEYNINVELLLRKFKEQYVSQESVKNIAKNKKIANITRFATAKLYAEEYFKKRFVGKPDANIGKIFTIKKNDYAFVAYDGEIIIAIRVGGLDDKEGWNFKGRHIINSIIKQISK